MNATTWESTVTQAPATSEPYWRRHLDVVALSLLTVLYALWYLAQRGEDEFKVGGAAVFVVAAVAAAGISAFAAWRNAGETRLAWTIVAGGCAFSAGGIALFAADHSQNPLSGRSVLLHLGWIGLVAALAGGILVLGLPAQDADAWRKLVLDLTPTVVALAVAVWLAVFGPSAIDDGASWRLRAAAAVHGGGALVLLMSALAGSLRPARSGDRASVRLLSLSAAILAGADLLWLRPWLGGSTDASFLAQLGFLVGFFGVATAALRACAPATVSGTASSERPADSGSDWFPQVPHLSLLALLLLAWEQVRFGDLQPYGSETAIVGSVAVVVFVMMRQALELRNARSLRGEIGELTEQIDGLIQQVGRDPLTGLVNRRAVLARLDHELLHGRTCGHPVAVALIDVDNFKTVNDTLGHQAGDRVLLAVGSILSATCRGTDVAARYAGDEFLLVLPGLNEVHAGQVCERIVHDVRRLAEELDLGGIRVTLSVGTAVTHHCKRTATQLIAIADAAMYDAKEGGKDRVVAVDADTLVPAGTPASELVTPKSDLTYLPSATVRAVGDRRGRAIVDRAS